MDFLGPLSWFSLGAGRKMSGAGSTRNREGLRVTCWAIRSRSARSAARSAATRSLRARPTWDSTRASRSGRRTEPRRTIPSGLSTRGRLCKRFVTGSLRTSFRAAYVIPLYTYLEIIGNVKSLTGGRNVKI